MKHLSKLLLLSIVALVCQSLSASAQTAQSVDTAVEQSQQMSAAEATNLPSTSPEAGLSIEAQRRISLGQSCVDVGRTLMVSGLSVTLSSTAFYFIASAVFNENSDPNHPQMPVFPIISLVGCAAGATMALVGLPIWQIGRDAVLSNGGSVLSLGDELPSGPALIFDAGVGIPPIATADLRYGYNFNPNLFVGGGIGVKMWAMESLYEDSGALASLPIYGEVRYTLGSKRIAPYVAASAGYDLAMGTPTLGLDFGTRFRSLHTKTNSYGVAEERDHSWWFSLKSQYYYLAKDDGIVLSLGIGRSF